MALPDGAVHRLGASGNVEGSIWEGRESLLVAALALPGDRAGLWEGVLGSPLYRFSAGAAVAGLPGR